MIDSTTSLLIFSHANFVPDFMFMILRNKKGRKYRVVKNIDS